VVAGIRIHRQNALMLRILKKLCCQSARCICLLLLCLQAQAANQAPKVLILNSYDESAAPYFRPTEAFRKQLQEYYTDPIAYQDIDLRQRRSEDLAEIDESIIQLLLNRYDESPPDLVAAVGPPAIDFWMKHRDSIFPNALFVATTRESALRQARLRPTVASSCKVRTNNREAGDNFMISVINFFESRPASDKSRTISAGSNRPAPCFNVRKSATM
jgi:hypothetical protein